MLEKNSIDLLKSLISFDTTSYKSNLKLIGFVENYLSGFGIKPTLVYDSDRKKANLYATIGPDGIRGAMLSGHTDVVPVDGQDWKYDPFSLTQKEDKLFGRGSADMKGFLALALSRVPNMVKANLSKPIHLAFSYDEEIGCVGVHSLIDLIERSPICPEYCIVGEPTGMEVVIGHKGKCGYHATIRGLACHSGQAPLGVNAINYAAKLMLYISKLAEEKSLKGPFDHDFEIPYTTLHTGLVSGGTAVNIVPDLCQFEFEIRHLAEDNPKEMLSRIESYVAESILPEMHKVSKETGIHIEEKVSYPGLLIEKDSDLVKFIKKLLGNQSHKKEIFGSEGGLFQNKLNLPTVVCGPGSISQAHKANEFISLDQLAMGGKFLDSLIDSLSKH